MRESAEAKRKRAKTIITALEKAYPDAKCALDFTTPLELLVATILAAQCTDERVNIVTSSLFKKYRKAPDYAAASPKTFEREIQSTGFFRAKTKSVLGMASALMERHGGEVPRTRDALVALPGVGLKTANVVLGNAFGANVGVTVDTHVTRVANRLGLTDHLVDAVKIEQDLMRVVPRDDWAMWSHLLIHHGRAICQARKPRCETCPLLPHCPAGQKFLKAGKKNS